MSKDGKPHMVIGSPSGSHPSPVASDKVHMESRTLSPDTLRLLAGMSYNVGIDPDWTIWSEAAGILVGSKDLKEIESGTGTYYYGATDSRAVTGAAVGY